MENKFSYTVVGLFVVGLTAMMVIGGVWLSVGLTSKSYDRYIVYMTESVSGLSPKAPVKYNGVEVGNVSSIKLSKHDPKNVRLILDIEDGTPVTEATRAVLDSQGITGIAYIELTGGQAGMKPLTKTPGEKYPVIKTEPSLLFRLDTALSHLTGNLETITSGLSSVLTKQNTTAVRNILDNTEHLTARLSDNTERLEGIIKDTENTMKNASKASDQLPKLVKNFNRSAVAINAFSNKISEASDAAKITFDNSSAAMQTFNSETLPQASEIMNQLQGVLSNLQNVSEQMEQNPAVLIRGSQPAPPGPGER